MGKMKDLTGQRFSRLTVIDCAGKLDGRHYFWNCICDCGNTKVVLGSSLTSCNTRSCGCLAKETGIQIVRIPYTHIDKITLNDLLGEKFLVQE